MLFQSKVFLSVSSFALSIAAGAMAENLVANSGFDENLDGWWSTDNVTMMLNNGQLCVDVPGGTFNPWAVIVGVNDLPLVKLEEYEFAFSAKGGGPVRALVQEPVDPWFAYATITEQSGVEMSNFSTGFKSIVDRDDAQMVFQIGGSKEPWTLCLDDVALNSNVVLEVYEPDTGPTVRVNQVGYLPDGPKRATWVAGSVIPTDWRLLDGSGAEVASGATKYYGEDTSAGEVIQMIDFSGVDVTGDGFTLVVGKVASHPFSIREDIYYDLRTDALKYFYPARSGIEIDGAIYGEAYARPAGHLSVAPNTGDLAVGCQAPEISDPIYGEPWTCDYTLDVTGGWYDAGDHGKYVVNGGISVAQLLSTYERALLRDGTALAALGDGSLPLPEAGNGVPDILDEVRWELEWMLKMKSPSGEYAGLYHHKVHDDSWTGLPLMPHLDDKTRSLHRPSTAATLNVAAVAAQAARLYTDDAFTSTLIAAAMEAYEAAGNMPDVFAPAADGNSGGGPYDDTDLSDEFYWAAAELYLTTGEEMYLDDLKASPHWNGELFRPNGFDWKFVASLPQMNLATVPSGLSTEDLAHIRQTVIDAADGYLAAQATYAFGQVYTPEVKDFFDWGSNHLHLQNAIVLGAAYELSGDAKYRMGALEAVDYIFGRNALNLSYVTGWGDVYAENQHSRWFSAQLNADLPHPPVGSLAGGPNSSIQDPVAQGLFGDQGCPAQKCYVDDIESWSTNEITINWNASLAQFASWLADQ